jgi:DNA-directed RNA polymerase specialized sigma24 family protein
MWRGGFGDALDASEAVYEEEQLQKFYAASIHHTAKVKQPHDAEFDDYVQEGVIAAWKATQEPRREPVTYGAVSARRKITGLSTGRYPMTGSENPGTKTYDMARRMQREDFAVVPDIPATGDSYVEVERRVDMDRALEALEASDRLLARLVGADQPWAVIAAVLGVTVPAARYRWNRVVKPTLRESLALVAA